MMGTFVAKRLTHKNARLWVLRVKKKDLRNVLRDTVVLISDSHLTKEFVLFTSIKAF